MVAACWSVDKGEIGVLLANALIGFVGFLEQAIVLKS